MTKIKQDAGELCDPNHLPNESEAEMHAAMQKAQAAVQTQLQELTKTYQTLSDICQQKRDLYIVCVKFHMNLRQVSPISLFPNPLSLCLHLSSSPLRNHILLLFLFLPPSFHPYLSLFHSIQNTVILPFPPVFVAPAPTVE